MIDHLNPEWLPGWIVKGASFAPILLTVLLFFIIHRAQEVHGDLNEAFSKASKLKEQITEIKNTTVTIRTSIVELREKIHSSDLLAHGQVLFYNDKFDEALSIFKKVANEIPSDYQVNYWMGYCYFRLFKMRDALFYLEKALSIDENYEVLELISRIYSKKLRSPKSIPFLERALKLNQTKTIQTALAIAYSHFGREDEAKEILEKLIEIYPTSGDIVLTLSEILRKEKKYDEAIDLCTKTLIKSPKNWNLYTKRADILLERNMPGDEVKALKDLDAAYTGNKADRNIYLTRGAFIIKKAEKEKVKTKRKELVTEAIELYKDGLKNVQNKAVLNAKISFGYLILEEYDSTEQYARLSVTNEFPNIHSYFALYAALIVNKRWSSLQRNILKGKAIANKAWMHIHLSVYEIWAALFSNEYVSDIKTEIQNLRKSLLSNVDFLPERADWKYIKNTVNENIKNLADDSKEITTILWDFFDQKIDTKTTINSLEKWTI